MSQIRKSASFRSRIPIRKAKPMPRRCYSPEPYRKRNHSAMLDQSQNDDEHHHQNHHHQHHHPHNNNTQHQSIYGNGNKQDQRHTKLKLKRQRHLASTVAHHTQHKPIGSINDNTTNSMASTRPKTIYSSSSYSSSDESQESEAPIQYLLKQSASSAAIVRPPLNVSTDAMSLDGILDSISCGSISSPPSPANYLNPKDSYSSYDSLDKYNYALETLKLSDNGNYFNGNNCMLQPKCRQPYIHNSENMKTDVKITPKLPPRPPLPRSSVSSSTIDKDLAKQQQLSDWYYIKPGPKSPLPAQRNVKMQSSYSSTKPVTGNVCNHNSNKNNIYNTNNQRNDATFVKSSTTRTINTNELICETAKTNLNIFNENVTQRVENTTNPPFAAYNR